MFQINDDLSINITRGDIGVFTVDAVDEAGEKYLFQKGDVVRIKVTEKKACENVMFQKDFVVEEETEQVEIFLTEDDTKIGEVISKPTDYWYEVELNPLTNPQTIIGYDEDGAKIFKLYPEGKDVEPSEDITPEDIPIVDEELDLTSDRPVQNHVIAKAFLNIQEEIAKINVDTGLDNMATKDDLKTLESNIATNTSNIEDLSSTVNEHTEEIATLKDVIGYSDTEETSIAENIGKINSDVANVQTRLNNIQVGLEALTGLTAGGTTTKTITFPRAFADRPQCFVEPATSSFDAEIRVTNTSTTNMTISVKLPTSMTSLNVRWLAIL